MMKIDSMHNLLRIAKHILFIIMRKDTRARRQVNYKKEKHGSTYASWVICPDEIDNNSIIYSFGIGEDISFDLSIINKYGANIYAYDPTPRSLEWLRGQILPEQFKFFAYGLAHFNDTAKFYLPAIMNNVSHSLIKNENSAMDTIEVAVKTLSSFMNQNHHKRIDILKMDIEGAEYDVIDNILKEKLNIKQILVEFHHRFGEIGIEKTKKCISLLNENDYKIFYISPTGEEYCFIKI